MSEALPPGSVIGILGGGQLGRMLAMSAAQLGYVCHIYAPERDSVAAEVARYFTCAAYDDADALATFAKCCDVVTYEFENVPVDCAKMVSDHTPLRPNYKALEVAQDRAVEKQFVSDLQGKTAKTAFVETVDDLKTAVHVVGLPSILKTNRFGYDGKGQARLYDVTDIDGAWNDVGRQPSILEAFINFSAEFSVILARGADGGIAYYDSAENVHEGGILAKSIVPASQAVNAQVGAARNIAAKIAEKLDYAGVLTCEFFATDDGPIFNEMAPRVHNSGHWSIEGATVSQFENHIRAVCGLPLGDTSLTGARIEIDNIIGADADKWADYMADPNCHLHLYGKGAPSAGRKMGHATRVLNSGARK